MSDLPATDVPDAASRGVNKLQWRPVRHRGHDENRLPGENSESHYIWLSIEAFQLF